MIHQFNIRLNVGKPVNTLFKLQYQCVTFNRFYHFYYGHKTIGLIYLKAMLFQKGYSIN